MALKTSVYLQRPREFRTRLNHTLCVSSPAKKWHIQTSRPGTRSKLCWRRVHFTCWSISACCCCSRAWSWGGDRICCICWGVIICGLIIAMDTGTWGQHSGHGHTLIFFLPGRKKKVMRINPWAKGCVKTYIFFYKKYPEHDVWCLCIFLIFIKRVGLNTTVGQFWPTGLMFDKHCSKQVQFAEQQQKKTFFLSQQAAPNGEICYSSQHRTLSVFINTRLRWFILHTAEPGWEERKNKVGIWLDVYLIRYGHRLAERKTKEKGNWKKKNTDICRYAVHFLKIWKQKWKWRVTKRKTRCYLGKRNCVKKLIFTMFKDWGDENLFFFF